MSRSTAAEPLLTALPILPRPNLLFDRDQLQALKAKRADPRAEALFQRVLAMCDEFMDPASEEFNDWKTLKDPRWRLREGLKLAIGPIEPCAFVYAMTGERKYAELARNLVVTIIRKKLADQAYSREMKEFHTIEPYPGWRHSATHDFGNFSYALAIFYDLCHDILTAEERREFVGYAEECLRIALGMAPEIGRMALNNRGARCAMGNAMLALAVYEDAERELARYSIYAGMRLGEAFATYALDVDGAAFEGASYCITTPIMLANFGRALARRGLRDLSKHPNLKRMPDFLIYNLAPTHDQFLPINDCFLDLLPTGALVVSTIHRNRVHRWLYEELTEKLVLRSWKGFEQSYVDFLFHDASVQPVHPKAAGYPLAKHFRGRGVVSMLSSWEPDAAQLLFFSGPQVYGGHRQDDQNSFTFCALGEKFAWDGGYDNFAGVFEDRAYRRTEFHNAILIDGRGQNGYDNWHWPRGRIVDFRHHEEWTYTLGDAGRCYGIDGVIERADRHVFFRRGSFPYAVIVDDVIVDESEHDVTWNFVAHPHAKLQGADEGVYVVEAKTAAMNLRLLGTARLVWSQNMGGKMPRLQATQRARRARFAALLLPASAGLAGVDFRAVFAEDGGTIEISLNGKRDNIRLDLRDRSGIIAGDERPDLVVNLAGAGS